MSGNFVHFEENVRTFKQHDRICLLPGPYFGQYQMKTDSNPRFHFHGTGSELLIKNIKNLWLIRLQKPR